MRTLQGFCSYCQNTAFFTVIPTKVYVNRWSTDPWGSTDSGVIMDPLFIPKITLNQWTHNQNKPYLESTIASINVDIFALVHVQVLTGRRQLQQFPSSFQTQTTYLSKPDLFILMWLTVWCPIFIIVSSGFLSILYSHSELSPYR